MHRAAIADGVFRCGKSVQVSLKHLSVSAPLHHLTNFVLSLMSRHITHLRHRLQYYQSYRRRYRCHQNLPQGADFCTRPLMFTRTGPFNFLVPSWRHGRWRHPGRRCHLLAAWGKCCVVHGAPRLHTHSDGYSCRRVKGWSYYCCLVLYIVLWYQLNPTLI